MHDLIVGVKNENNTDTSILLSKWAHFRVLVSGIIVINSKNVLSHIYLAGFNVCENCMLIGYKLEISMNS